MTDEASFELVLAIMSGPDDGRKVRLRRSEGDGAVGANGTWSLTVGRKDDCDLCLPFDTQISREHARLVLMMDGQWVLEDSGSRNGTFVGKKRIESAVPIAPGILFRVGRTWLRLEAVE